MRPPSVCWIPSFITCKARGWLEARGTQLQRIPPTSWPLRPHAPPLRMRVGSHASRPQSAQLDVRHWVQQHVPLEGMPAMACGPNRRACRGTRANARPLLGRSGWTAISSSTGTAAPEIPPRLRDLPALEALRRIWLQQYYRCTVPGREVLRWRTEGRAPALGAADPLALRPGGPLQ